MKIVICGAHGQLGRECVQLLKPHHELHPFGSGELDITDAGAVMTLTDAVRPDALLNCAAYTRVDDCERERSKAWQVNAEGPRHLANASRRYGFYLLHVSTDYVFDGAKPPPEPYDEDDPPHPLSCYGETKLAGEEAIQATSPCYAILRTAWVYGIHGRNFLKNILRRAVDNPPPKELRVVHDQFGSPTWTWRLATQIQRLLQARPEGILHASGEGVCSWFDFASAFLQQMGVPHRLRPCRTEEFPTAAVRPRNSILENRRLKALNLNVMQRWEDDLEAFVRRFREDLLQEVAQGQP